MVFLGVDFFTREVPIYTLMEDLLQRGKYKGLMLSVTDDMQEAIDTIMAFPTPAQYHTSSVSEKGGE